MTLNSGNASHVESEQDKYTTQTFLRHGLLKERMFKLTQVQGVAKHGTVRKGMFQKKERTRVDNLRLPSYHKLKQLLGKDKI